MFLSISPLLNVSTIWWQICFIIIVYIVRCSSITFDLTDAEGYNRNRSKSRKRKEKDKKESKEESQANIFARDEPEVVERGRDEKGEIFHVS